MASTATSNGVHATHLPDGVKSTEKMTDTEKVEMSEVPLTSDTDKPVDEHKEGEVKKEDKGKSRKVFQFLSRDRSGERKAKKEVMTATDGKEEAVVMEKKEVKPVRTWFQKKPKGAQNGPDSTCEKMPMTIGINLLDRDEKNINEHVKLAFEDVFAEPDGYHSFDCAWRLTYRVFTGARCFFYRLLSLLCALPCAILWGLVFALLTVTNIWACVPFGRALTIPATWLAKVWNFFVRSLLDPLFRACGLCLGNITVRRYGFPNDPTTEMAHLA